MLHHSLYKYTKKLEGFNKFVNPNEGIRIYFAYVVSEIRKTLAQNIRHYRKLHNLSQETLGFKCGMSNVYISRIESGDFAVSIDTLDRIAKALEVKPSLLLEPESYKSE